MSDPYVAAVESMRRDKDDAFRRASWSPIRDRHAFRGLAYYPVDPAYRVGTSLHPHAGPQRLLMQTSDGQAREYVNVGEFRLGLPVGNVTLQAYQRPGHEGLFVPFRDATSGKETYGGGRYLDLESEEGPAEYVVDLNFAYHPYCAYDDAYSCPLPPAENWLHVAIRAGERG